MNGSDVNDPVPPGVRDIQARTEASIREADLAQAIVSLARFAEMRRGARLDLIEASDTVARAIRKELRSGDQVTIPTGEVVSVGRTTATRLGVTYRADRVHSGPNWNDVLLRNGAILGLPEEPHPDRIRMVYHDSLGQEHRPATAEDRERFIAERHAVVQAFNKLLKGQAASYDAAARSATKPSVK